MSSTAFAVGPPGLQAYRLCEPLPESFRSSMGRRHTDAAWCPEPHDGFVLAAPIRCCKSRLFRSSWHVSRRLQIVVIPSRKYIPRCSALFTRPGALIRPGTIVIPVTSIRWATAGTFVPATSIRSLRMISVAFSKRGSSAVDNMCANKHLYVTVICSHNGRKLTTWEQPPSRQKRSKFDLNEAYRIPLDPLPIPSEYTPSIPGCPPERIHEPLHRLGWQQARNIGSASRTLGSARASR